MSAGQMAAFLATRNYPPDRVKEIMAREHQAIEYHAFLAREYRRAVRYPWLPEPEPPFR